MKETIRREERAQSRPGEADDNGIVAQREQKRGRPSSAELKADLTVGFLPGCWLPNIRFCREVSIDRSEERVHAASPTRRAPHSSATSPIRPMATA